MRSPAGDISVITSITAGKDILRDDQQTHGARFLAYVAEPFGSKVWEERPAFAAFRSARRNSRAPKILSHRFSETTYSIWLDGNIALRIDPSRLVELWLPDHDLAVFRHPERECIYDEARVCIGLGLDDPDVIRAQTERYAAEGFSRGQGLGEANVIVRRHTPEVIEFNRAWWAEYSVHSVRDQISFMYSIMKSGLRVNWITPAVRRGNPYFHVVDHLTEPQEPR
jgi:hypothetical protein